MEKITKKKEAIEHVPKVLPNGVTSFATLGKYKPVPKFKGCKVC